MQTQCHLVAPCLNLQGTVPPLILEGKGIAKGPNHQAVTYLPSGKENVLNQMAVDSGRRVVNCWGWELAKDGLNVYRAAIDSRGRVVVLQPVLGQARITMLSDFPFGELRPMKGVGSDNLSSLSLSFLSQRRKNRSRSE